MSRAPMLPELLRDADVIPFEPMAPDPAGGAHVLIDGARYLSFASYNYLDLNRHEAVLGHAVQALQNYGLASCASRYIGGTTDLNADLEHALGAWLGAEAALVFPTTWMCVVSILKVLCDAPDVLLMDERMHNSSAIGSRLCRGEVIRFRHNDVDDLALHLERIAGRGVAPRRVTVLTEGIFSFSGAIAPCDRLYELCREHGATLVVDEAHSIGVLGESGGGVREHFGLGQDVDVLYVGSLGKALGCAGGYVAGRSEPIAALRDDADSYVFSSGLSPVFSAAGTKVIELMRGPAGRELLSRLRHNVAWLKARARALGLRVAPSDDRVPLVVFEIGDDHEALAACERLRRRYKIVAYPILHPWVGRGRAVIRLFLNVTHTESDLDYVLCSIQETLGEAALQCA